jgi:hypothetical protein
MLYIRLLLIDPFIHVAFLGNTGASKQYQIHDTNSPLITIHKLTQEVAVIAFPQAIQQHILVGRELAT